ncbi:hypothetical protein QWI17_20050 [Gilvimarinus sp. SDUM040013]|uniref:Insecticidal crystal toxin domain-containing protein n=1 Tax=Gilvimarinus gilvus TaxID=3058038 RepID=A0ABU4RZH6_9GAMM|nr:hypothetical protein [Gilvimarinus sp. SDUM040013]MDO3388149.1 hypothetical protein [Gilvimarinus sp. SDUM040013]MDX6850276.1 hypothetical protein [Gilvimarinus sp. SDUM040013]
MNIDTANFLEIEPFTLSQTDQLYLQGMLCSPEKPASTHSVEVRNNLPIAVNVALVSNTGQLMTGDDWNYDLRSTGDSKAKHTLKLPSKCVLVFTDISTGAFITTRVYPDPSHDAYPDKDKIIDLWVTDLIPPGAIGAPPKSGGSTIIPPQSQSVLVGYGHIRDSDGHRYFALRSQNWQLSPDSYSIIPGQSEESTVGVTVGHSEFSSTSELFSKQMSISSGASWFGVNASISAALTRDTSVQHSLTYTEETYYEKTINISAAGVESPTVIYLWQIHDCITLIKFKDKDTTHPTILASSENVLAPALPRVHQDNVTAVELLALQSRFPAYV